MIDSYLIQRANFKNYENDSVGIDSLLKFSYMGSSEFEFGAIPKSLKRIRENKDLYIQTDIFLKGYDNKKLAENRAKNFIAALKDAGVNTGRYIANYVVGKSTVPNSPQANAEQNVTFKIKKDGSTVRFELERDNTAVVVPKIFKIKDVAPPIIIGGDYEYMVYKVTYKKVNGPNVAEAIGKAAKESGAYLRNITKEYTNLLNKK